MHLDHIVDRRARRKDTLSAEDLGILLQWQWKYDDGVYNHERQRVQMSLLMLFSSFTGTRPGVLLDRNEGTHEASLGDLLESGFPSEKHCSGAQVCAQRQTTKRKLYDEQSDLPEFMERPEECNTIRYRDVELFLLRNSANSERDVLLAEVDFTNLKGRPQGADG